MVCSELSFGVGNCVESQAEAVIQRTLNASDDPGWLRALCPRIYLARSQVRYGVTLHQLAMTVELIVLGPLDRRRCCECCGFPTLGVPDEHEPDPEWELTRTSCELCEWDNRPLDRTGDVRTDLPPDEERNDGLSLATARAHYAQFLSIYDPADPPTWRVTPPRAEVTEARAVLRTAYEAALACEIPGRYERWGDVQRCEYALCYALAEQRHDDEFFDADAT